MDHIFEKIASTVAAGTRFSHKLPPDQLSPTAKRVEPLETRSIEILGVQ
jgi:hypothetical protein